MNRPDFIFLKPFASFHVGKGSHVLPWLSCGYCPNEISIEVGDYISSLVEMEGEVYILVWGAGDFER